MEARYAGGTGVLLGSGAHWVLMTDPGDEQVVEEVWEALTTAAPSGAGTGAGYHCRGTATGRRSASPTAVLPPGCRHHRSGAMILAVGEQHREGR